MPLPNAVVVITAFSLVFLPLPMAFSANTEWSQVNVETVSPLPRLLNGSSLSSLSSSQRSLNKTSSSIATSSATVGQQQPFTDVREWARHHINATSSGVLFVMFMDEVYGRAARCYYRYMRRRMGVSPAMAFYGSVSPDTVGEVGGIHMSCIVSNCNHSTTFDDFFGSHHDRSSKSNEHHTRLSLLHILVNAGLDVPFVVSDADIVWFRFPGSLVNDVRNNDFVCTKEFVYTGKKRRTELNVGIMGGHTGRPMSQEIFTAFAEDWKRTAGWEQDIVNRLYPHYLRKGLKAALLPQDVYRYILPCRWAMETKGKSLGKRRQAELKRFVTAHFAGTTPINKRKCLILTMRLVDAAASECLRRQLLSRLFTMKPPAPPSPMVSPGSYIGQLLANQTNLNRDSLLLNRTQASSSRTDVGEEDLELTNAELGPEGG